MNIMCGRKEKWTHEENEGWFCQDTGAGTFPAESQTGNIRGKEAGLGGRKRGSVSLKWADRPPYLPLVPFCNTAQHHATSTLLPPAHSLDGRNSDVIHFSSMFFHPPSLYCFRVVSGGCRHIEVTDGRRRKCDFSTPAGWTCSGWEICKEDRRLLGKRGEGNSTWKAHNAL